MPRRKAAKRSSQDVQISPSRRPPKRQSQRISDAQKRQEYKEAYKVAEENQSLLPSPNKQTRQRREESQVGTDSNSVEKKRLAKILLSCSENDKVPCSLYGRDRQTKYPGFKFCSKCYDADTAEQTRPNCFINRKAKDGRYTCQSNHTSFVRPTHRDPKSKYYPLPPPTSLFCIPLEQRKTTNPDPPDTKAAASAPPSSLEEIMFNRNFGTSNDSPDYLQQQLRQLAESISEEEIPQSFQTQEESSKSHETPSTTNKNSPDPQEPEDFPDDNSLDDLPPWECEVDMEEQDDLPPFPNLHKEAQRTYESDPNLERYDSAVDSTHDENVSLLQQKIIELTLELEQTKKDLDKCRANLKQRNDDVGYWRKKDKDRKTAEQTTEKPSAMDCLPKSCYKDDDRATLVEHIRQVLKRATSNMEPTSRAAGMFFRDVACVCLDKRIHHGLLFESSYQVFRQYVRNFVYTPYNILKKMDLMGGRLNFGGIEVLRSVETNGKSHQRTLLPSTSALQDCANKVEQYGSRLCPYKLMRNKTTGAEGFTFRASDVMSCILISGHCLYGDAKWRPIRLAQSLDGALFTRNLSHTLGGLKFNDSSNSLAQSRNSCFPIVCVCQPESKGLVRSIFRNMFQEIREGAMKILPKQFGIWPLQICTNCDMSCEWKLLGRGGAAQQVTFPCSKCTVRSGELHLSKNRVSACKLCKQLKHVDKPGWVCYHHTMCTPEHMADMHGEVKRFTDEMPEIQKKFTKIWADSMISIPNDQRLTPSDKELGDIRSIHFDLTKASAAERREYARILTNDLVERKLDVSGTLKDRQGRLKTYHIREWEYYQASRVIEDYKASSQSTAMVYLMDTVPCILHMENRMGIKILSMALKYGLQSAMNDELAWIPADKRTNEGDRCTAFIQTINDVMCRFCLGTVELPTHWKAPYDENKKELGAITMDNVRIRRLLPHFDKLVKLCIHKESDRVLWSECVGHYRESMRLINVKTDMTQTQIEDYQKSADYFFQIWVRLTGEHGITNYCHLIGSGHLFDYLEHWKNLSSHAQQGWEGEFSPFACELHVAPWSVFLISIG